MLLQWKCETFSKTHQTCATVERGVRGVNKYQQIRFINPVLGLLTRFGVFNRAFAKNHLGVLRIQCACFCVETCCKIRTICVPNTQYALNTHLFFPSAVHCPLSTHFLETKQFGVYRNIRIATARYAPSDTQYADTQVRKYGTEITRGSGTLRC